MSTNTIPLPGSHFISLPLAIAMTAKYRTEMENILAEEYRDQGILAISETFNRDAFDALLALEGCAGLRIYYGMDEALEVHAIIVAINDANEDILPPATQTEANTPLDEDGYIVEEGQRCPPLCPIGSPLSE